MPDKDFNNHKGINVADGTDLQDAVNLKQLKTENTYYMDTSQTNNIINLSILPLTELTDGLHVWIKVRRNNTDADVKIKISEFPQGANEIPVVDFNGNSLSVGMITGDSIREFVYVANDGTAGNRFRLINRDADFLYRDLDFQGHKGIRVADGTVLSDAVNLKQLKSSGNFYESTKVDDNTASIDIFPLDNLVKGFNFYTYFTFDNTGAFNIRVMNANTVVDNVRVLNVQLNPLTGGEIETASITHFVYHNDIGLEGGPAFINVC